MNAPSGIPLPMSPIVNAVGALASRLDFTRYFEQTNRLLAVETALPTTALIPEAIYGREALSEPTVCVVDLVATSAHLPLKSLTGEQISLRIALPTGEWAVQHGYVMEAQQLGSDGSNVRYRCVMHTFDAFLMRRINSRQFQDKTTVQIVETILQDYPQANLRIEVTETLRVRSICRQHQETDFDFMQRLLREEGLTYYFIQLDGDAARQAHELGQAKHVMVITDRQAERPALNPEVIRFSSGHLPGGTAILVGQPGNVADTIHQFDAVREVQPSSVTLGAYNYKHVVGTAANVESNRNQGDIPQLEDYDGSGHYRYENNAHAQRAADLRLQAHELKNKRFEGASGCRHMGVGRTFRLIDHPHYGANVTALTHAGQLDYAGALTASHQRPDNEFIITVYEFEAVNNLGANAARLYNAPTLEKGSYTNRFVAVPAAAPLVLPFHRKPTAPNHTTALVVGLQNEAVTTDRDHRVKVQFHWQRGQNPNAGGFTDTGNSTDAGNAPNNETSGTWVRVAESLAGPNWGSQFTPRIGTEVLITFLDGDIDRPLILSQLHNGQDTPPFSAGIDSGTNHAGTVSGLDIPTLNRDGKSQLLFDDAPGQVRTQLRTQSPNSPHTSLTLGYIIRQPWSGAQRGDFRGSGFEATTDGWITWRANAGMLISTHARPYGQGVQMEAPETLALLRAANDLRQRLNDSARGAQAHTLDNSTAPHALPELIKTIDPKQDGKYDAPVNGQDHTKPTGDQRRGGDPVEKFGKPIVLMETPSSAALATPGLIAAYAGQDQSLIAQTDAQLTAAHTASLASGETTSLFTQEGGIQAIAANGPVSLKAHTGALAIRADKSVSVVSVNDTVYVQAKDRILLHGGASSIDLNGADIVMKTPGSFTVKGAQHVWAGAGGNAAVLPNLPDSRLKLFDEAFVLKDEKTGQPLANMPYRIKLADGSYEYGQTDDKGQTHLARTTNAEGLSIEIASDQGDWPTA